MTGPPVAHTLTTLKRWSCQEKYLPPVSTIKNIHVYDFDNTLFTSPLPSKQIWTGPTLGQLQSQTVFTNGGWWHDAGILAATGQGVEKEEPRAWRGWWNEQIVELVELSMVQKDTLTVLLTGRAEREFADLIKRIVNSKRLEFDMVCLKPTVGPKNESFGNTMDFKQQLLKEIVYTYKEAEEIRVYEDRQKHVKGFREFFFAFNKALMAPEPAPVSRKSITAEVIQVPENATSLNPVSEIAEVQRMINVHNTAVRAGVIDSTPYQIKRTVFYTAYLIPTHDTEKLLALVNIPPGAPDNDIRFLANTILITPRPATMSILEKVGGIGKKLRWRVTGTAIFENKVWAARVEPIPATEKVYSENPVPTVVLALRRGARPIDAGRIQNWHPVPDDKAFEFEACVGEKVLCRIEEETPDQDEWEGLFPRKNNKRLHPREEEYISLNSNQASHQHHMQPHYPTNEVRPRAISGNYRGGNQNRGRGNGDKGRGNSGRGRGGGFDRRGGGGGGRRGRGGYKSLDDVQPSNGNGYGSFDDY